MGSALDSPHVWNVSEELEQRCVVGFNPCLRKAMTAMVELDKTRMCNLLGNELTQLPWNEEIIRGSNQQRRVSDTLQAFSGVISEQRIDARRRDFLRRMPGRAAPIKNPPARTALACGKRTACAIARPAAPKLRRGRGTRYDRSDRLRVLAQWYPRSNVRPDAPDRDLGDR